jgi:hypothetical protein
MKRNLGFDEVMIVNPYEPGSNANQGVRFMRFNAAPPEMGYYSEPPAQYGYYGEPPVQYGYYGEPPVQYGYYGEPASDYGYYANSPERYGEFAPGYNQAEPVGYIAENYPMGYYGDPYAMGAYAESEPMGYYGYYAEAPHMEGYYAEAPMEGYYAEAPQMEGCNNCAPMGYYAEAPGYAQYAEAPGYAQYAEAREMPGYAQYEPLAENYSEMGDYGAYGADYGESYAGYVRETEPRYNAGCPMPTNVHGFSEVDAVDGYVRPSTVNPTCGQFTPQPRQSSVIPDGFKPLW